MKRTFLRIIRFGRREGAARVLIPPTNTISSDKVNDKYLLLSRKYCNANAFYYNTSFNDIRIIVMIKRLTKVIIIDMLDQNYPVMK